MPKKESWSRKQKEAKELTLPVNIGSDHIRGPANNNAPITLVEYLVCSHNYSQRKTQVDHIDL